MKSFSTYKIFVGGPSDVAPEIELARDIISEISIMTRPLGVIFETFYWATDVTPGIAKEVQARINDQADGYDAFLAVLGSKIGSPTNNFKSGTVEEIETAIEKSDISVFGLDSVMIFFKETNISSKSPNLKSLLAIQEFRESIGSRGIMFKEFADEIDFRQSILKSFGNLLKKHLDNFPIRSTNLSNEQENPTPTEPRAELDAIDTQDDDDLGIIDLDSIIAENMTVATHHSEILTNAITKLGESTEEHTKELSQATVLKDMTLGKSIIIKISEEMIFCANSIKDILPIIETSFENSMKYTRRLIEIRLIDSNEGEDDYNSETIDAISSMASMSETNIMSFQAFQKSVQEMPRMTKEINIAKRILVSELSNLISLFELIQKTSIDVLNFYEGIKREAGRT